MNSDIPDGSVRWTARGASILMLFAGIIHLIIIPHHWEHAPAHGIFMGIIGLVEIAWGIAFGLKPTHRLAQVGIIIAVSCITLWGITRIFPAPFGHGPEEVDASGVITKVLELIATFSLIGIIQALSFRKRDYRLWRTVIAIFLLAVFLGFGAYGVARASEPLFPWLTASEVQEHEQHGQQPTSATQMPGMDDEPMILPTP